MELTTAMLADAANKSADGKLNVLGGQWDRIGVSALPAIHPSLALVVVLKVDWNEALQTHELAIDLTKDGTIQGVGARGRLATGHPPGVAEGAPLHVAETLTFPNVHFPTAGRYEWVIEVDGNPLGRLPLDVALLPGIPAPPPPRSSPG